MLIKYTRYEFKRRWLHPPFARNMEKHTFKINKADTFLVNTIEDIKIEDYKLEYNIEILTLQEANELLVSWNHAQLINEDFTIGENEEHVELVKWTKKKFRLKFSFDERVKFENYEYFIDQQGISVEEKVVRKMQMKTLTKDFEEHDQFWNTDQNLKEMLMFLESIGFIAEGKAGQILSGE